MPIKFNPGDDTWGELLSPAMEITDQAEADQYLADYTVYIEERLTPDRMLPAGEIARRNLGYFAGYFDNNTRARVEKLFGCVHPIFGSIEKNGPPTVTKAFASGVAMGKRMKRLPRHQ